MNEVDQTAGQGLSEGIRIRIRTEAFSAFIAAALLLYFGFYGGAFSLDPSDQVYNFSISVYELTLRGGGLALLVSGALLALGLRYALLFDAVVSFLIGICFIFVGVVWSTRGYPNGYLLLIFAALFVHAAYREWKVQRIVNAALQSTSEAPPSHEPVNEAAKAEARERLLGQSSRTVDKPPTANPVESPKPEVKESPEPPGGGFLADLGRDEEER